VSRTHDRISAAAALDRKDRHGGRCGQP